jgi:uncharacterized protein (UPF0332 family)
MRQFENQEEAYDWCLNEGNYIPAEEYSIERINANLTIAKEDLEIAKGAAAKKRWNSTFKLYYDIIHQLAEAFLLFDKIKSKNHLCLFTNLCVEYPELELDWGFFEAIRTKRNGLHYYGTLVTNKDWKEVALVDEKG